MATEIEQTIYKLDIDESGYIKGVDNAVASTDKLSTSQSIANAKLTQLKEETILAKEETKQYTKELKENEKAITAATAKYNFLKGSLDSKITAEAATELQKYTDKHKDLAAKIVANTLRVESLNKAQKELNKTLSESGKHHDLVSAALSKFGNVNHLVAEEIQLANRRVARFGVDLAVGFAGGLIGVAIPATAKFAEELVALAFKESEAEKKAKLFNETMAAGTDGFVKATTDVQNLTHDIALAKAGFTDKKTVIDEYNESIGKTTGLVKTLDEAEQGLVKNSKDYIQATLLKAAATFSQGKAAQAQFEKLLEEKKPKTEQDTGAEGFFSPGVNALSDAINNALGSPGLIPKLNPLGQIMTDKKNAAVKEKDETFKLFSEINEDLQKQLDDLYKKHPEWSINGFKKPTKGKKEIQNIYIQERDKLKADIAKLDEKGFTDEATITKAVEEDFVKRSDAFDKALKNKQLTAPQVKSLKGYLDNLQKLTLAQSLKSFHEQKTAYLKQISDELSDLQYEENIKRISTIQDTFERERQLIIAETDKTENAIKEKRDKLIVDATKNAAKNGLKPEDIAPQLDKIKSLYSNLLDDLNVIKNQKLQQLSFATFEKLSEDAKRLLDAGDLGISEGSLVNIKKQTDLFNKGKINFKEYQKALTDIARFETNERFRLEKLFLQQEIKVRQDKLKNDKTLTEDQIKRLQDEITKLRQQLADAEKGNAVSGVKDQNSDSEEKLSKLLKYADAIHSVVDSVIQFWQAANDAESKALDRSISLQEKRVDAAQRIAARGNAQYLKLEEDRLKELNVQRENAARKQLGIDAALQASQILVGITGAIAKIAAPGIGVAETIGEIAIIVGALATGYALVRSLQGNQPKFFVGTKDTGPGGAVDSKGGFNAVIHPHEAITPADKNKAYHPTIEAIHDGTISPETLNGFVKHYHKIKAVPQPNYQRIKEAAEISIGADGRMFMAISDQNKLIMENNALQKQTLRYMKNMGVNVNLDKNGFAVTQMEVMEQMRIAKLK